MQSALDLANSGIKVYLVEKTPSIGGKMAQLDKTFPTNDCAMCTISPKLVECGRHKDIQIISNAELLKLEGEPGNFTATVLHHSSYVSAEKCTGCGQCALVCPVKVPSEYDEKLANRQAIYTPFQQAMPKVYAIEKKGWSPCRDACPAGVNAQGYTALISEGKFKEALGVVRNTMPFASVCGRVCVHPCEKNCERGKLDQPIALRALKRFIADYELKEGRQKATPVPITRTDKVAIVGSGPAGLTCAYDLVKMGYPVTVFEAMPKAGGLLRYGIPEYRLPGDQLDNEISHVQELGAVIKTNSPVNSLAELQKQGYAAFFLANGAWSGQKMGIPGEDTPGVIEALRFLREARQDKAPRVGGRVAVVGGGNAAIDAARVALRLGAKEVSILYRRSKAEMPADPHEVRDAEHEGITIQLLTAPTRVISKDGKLSGVECVRMALGEPDASGRRRPIPVKGSEFFVHTDSLIIAIGQAVDKSTVLQGLALTQKDAIQVDAVTLQTSTSNVFAGGDLVTGPASVIQAVAAGKEAAISIDRWLRNVDMKSNRPARLPRVEVVNKEGIAKQPRQEPGMLPAESRKRGFEEVELTLDEASAIAEAKRCLNCAVCSECLQCVAACGPNAIDHRMKDEILDIKVGAVVACPGYSLYDPKLSEEFGFGRYQNVVTSMQFERLLSASGPTRGHIARPSDHKDPKRIAFLQCVGSRDQNHKYCSSVCCMYATKEAMLAQEHVKGVECTVFYMDIRAFGKGFDAFYKRAQDQGVKYIRSRPSSLREVPGSRNILVKYEKAPGELAEEEFDIVVLSVGLEAPKDAIQLAHALGIKTREAGFCFTEPYRPVETSRPGVFIAGAFAEPKDIPDSVTQASGAAAAALAVVGKSRGTMLSEKAYPAEDAEAEKAAPRIGVFVCHCGSNIAGVVDVTSVTEFARTLPNVAYADHLMYSCSADSLKNIVEKVKEHKLNRVIVSSCTPRTHEPLFQDTIREAGLNPYLFEMANIRDQCSWVHSKEPAKATAKAKSLVSMAVGRAALLRPLHKEHLGLNHGALVVGGGVAGMSAALVLADQGFPVVLVEQEKELGGRLRRIWHAVEGNDPQAFLNSLVERVTSHENIDVVTNSRVVKTSGSVGNFKTTIVALDAPTQRLIEHGVAILATGGNEYRGQEYMLGQSEQIITMGDLEEKIEKAPQEIAKLNEVAMVLCVGPWKEKNFYCSRTCCTVSLKNAIKIKELNPSANVYVLHKDLRSYGFKERLYTEAREKGVIFVRYTDDRPPVVESVDGRVRITVWEPNLGEEMKLDPDILALATATVPTPNAKDLGLAFKLPLTQEGFFLEAHVKLRPVDFASEGIFLCGTAHYPKFIDETVSQAMAAAARASTILAKDYLEAGGAVSVVDPKKCVACLTCVRVCPYGVPRINADGVAEIPMASCQGCGVCAGECPAKAIELLHYRDAQIICKSEALLQHEPAAVKS